MKQLLLVLPALWLLVACRGGEGETTIVDSMENSFAQSVYKPWEYPYPNLTDGERRQLVITCIANGDKETFAKLVRYPIRRDYPLRDIENEQMMIDKFDLIFDARFRDTLRTMDSNSWEEVGWRGTMLCRGMLWEYGPVKAINYSSPLEQKYRQKIIDAEISMLHPTLQGPWEPIERVLLDDKNYSFARIDWDTTRTYGFRLTLFKKGADIGDKPALTLYGKYRTEGSIGYEIYTFFDNYVKDTNDDVDDDCDDYDDYDKIKSCYKARYEPDKYPEDESEWETFRPYILLTTPKGDEVKLIIAKKHYYQSCAITVE